VVGESEGDVLGPWVGCGEGELVGLLELHRPHR
jgi:hypothetical protein